MPSHGTKPGALALRRLARSTVVGPSLFLAFLAGCNADLSTLTALWKEPEPVSVSPPVPASAPEPTSGPALASEPAAATPVPPELSPIAHLVRFTPAVSVRRRAELQWRDVMPNLPFFDFDAVRTDSRADAVIGFTNGSALELAADTLVILSPEAVGRVPKLDRATVRSGKLVGKTTGELWLLTSAALVRMRASGKRASARIGVDVREGKEVALQLTEGDAVVIRKRTRRKKEVVEATPLIRGAVLKMAAPIQSDTYGNDEETARLWEALTAVPDPVAPEKPQRRDIASQLVVTEPPDLAEVESDHVWIRGTVSLEGGTVQINGKRASTTPGGTFQGRVDLAPGANTISIQLVGRDGSSTSRRLVVIRGGE